MLEFWVNNLFMLVPLQLETRNQKLETKNQHWLEQHWYRLSPLHFFLWPLSLLFQLLVWLRYQAYRLGIFPQIKLDVPVIVVGNITVGGSGKTPLVLGLAQLLKEKGWRPGIISRGYGRSSQDIVEVSIHSDVAAVGDEPLLLAQRQICPVWVGADRAKVARALLRAHPTCNVIISDDGLQHYRLERDIEIAVFDERGIGNGLLLPAGPLREGTARLKTVDALIMNDTQPFSWLSPKVQEKIYTMVVRGDTFYQLNNPALVKKASDFLNQELHALAGIAYPLRFLKHLRALGLHPIFHAFPDHHLYSAKDFKDKNGAAILLITEKDAVKCARFNLDNVWVLKADACLSPDFNRAILNKLQHVSQKII